MTRLRHPSFEQPLFDDPDDPVAWAVYADWLAERGDPIGELIQLELEIEAAVARGVRPDPTVTARCAALAHDGPRRWAPTLTGLDASMAIEWRRGTAFVARLSKSSIGDAVRDLERLFADDGARFLVELQLGLTIARDDLELLPATLWIDDAGEPRLPSLRTLELDGHASLGRQAPLAVFNFDWAVVLPQLRTLHLRAPGLRLGNPRLAHPRLRSLVVSMRGGFDLSLVETLSHADFPALERLTMWLGRVPDDQRDRSFIGIEGLIDNPRLGPIRELGLNASTLTPMMTARLAASSLIRGLERLELAWSMIGDEHLPALRALLDEATRLRVLVLRGNYLSSKAVAELRSRFAGRLVADRQKPDGDRQLPVFGRYGVPDLPSTDD